MVLSEHCFGACPFNALPLKSPDCSGWSARTGLNTNGVFASTAMLGFDNV